MDKNGGQAEAVRYPPESVAYADCAFVRTDGGGIAVGVELRQRLQADDGRISYEPVRVFSLIYPDMPSIRQSIPTVAAEVLRNLDDDTRLVIFWAGSVQFQKYQSFEEAVGPYAVQAGVNVKFRYKLDGGRVFTRPSILANDAIKRGHSIIADV